MSQLTGSIVRPGKEGTMNNHEDIVPKSKDSRYETMEGEKVTSYFAFEPDPDMEGGPVSFCVDVKTKSDPVNGTLFFSSLEEIEECANILLDYVRKHKK